MLHWVPQWMWGTQLWTGHGQGQRAAGYRSTRNWPASSLTTPNGEALEAPAATAGTWSFNYFHVENRVASATTQCPRMSSSLAASLATHPLDTNLSWVASALFMLLTVSLGARRPATGSRVDLQPWLERHLGRKHQSRLARRRVDALLAAATT